VTHCITIVAVPGRIPCSEMAPRQLGCADTFLPDFGMKQSGETLARIIQTESFASAFFFALTVRLKTKRTVDCFRGHASLHGNGGAHPRMDAALKVMLALGEIRDVELTALKDAGSGDGDFGKAAGALGNDFLTRRVETRDEAATELCNFGEGMRLAALVDRVDRCSLFDGERVGLEIPVGVGSSSGRLGEQCGKGSGGAERNVFAELGAYGGGSIECGRITFVQGNNLGGTWSVLEFHPACEQKTTDDQTALHEEIRHIFPISFRLENAPGKPPAALGVLTG